MPKKFWSKFLDLLFQQSDRHLCWGKTHHPCVEKELFSTALGKKRKKILLYPRRSTHPKTWVYVALYKKGLWLPLPNIPSPIFLFTSDSQVHFGSQQGAKRAVQKCKSGPRKAYTASGTLEGLRETFAAAAAAVSSSLWPWEEMEKAQEAQLVGKTAVLSKGRWERRGRPMGLEWQSWRKQRKRKI